MTAQHRISFGFRPAGRTLRFSRFAVGVSRDSKLLLVVVLNQVTLDEMASIMLKLGAADAMNVDGGSSYALYADGRIQAQPSARMSNVLLVTRRK